ncbi:MAG TPA: TonB-dependent receptor [Steroidobacteraceae bacterium]|nr:TonB-dependent receptor [Steroidobacteraceae bacterium]
MAPDQRQHWKSGAKKWLTICGVALPLHAAASHSPALEELKNMSFEELMNVEITSVSRHEEPLRDAAAAVAIVTPEIIRRSGATSVPDSLRLVPGIHVGGRHSSSWAVSSRGFSSVNSEKLLVLTDTRSIYTPLVSGVAWDVQDYLLADVERVEVIRGPGASLWGSNAVNGVINITTRSARVTHGSFVSAQLGTFDRATLEARHGGESAGGVHYRVFGKYLDREGTLNTTPDTDDAWSLGHVGFRTDWDGSSHDSFTVQGDMYSGDIGQLAPAVSIIGREGPTGPLNVDVSGGNVLARWRRHGDDGSDTQLRAYYDYTHRNDPSFTDTLHTFDVDLQRRFTGWNRHEILWGLAWRLTSNDNHGKGVFAVDPEESDDNLFSGFIQDQVALSDSLRFTVGTKLEHNDFSGFEVQPSVRLAWLPGARQTLWAAISRAVRVPTRLERDIAIEILPPGSNPTGMLLGSDDFESEELIAYEGGYRWQARDRLSFDLATFYNDYDKLASLELGDPFVDGDGRTVFPIVNQNLTRGRTYGAELQAEWEPLDDWRLTASYSYIDMELTATGQDANRGEWVEDSTPRNIAGLRSFYTCGDFDIDAQLRYQSEIGRQSLDATGAGIDGYTELDLRFGWRASTQWEISLVGQNLLHDDHIEFGPPGQRGAFERSAYLRASWRN